MILNNQLSTPAIDWSHYEGYARGLTNAGLAYARKDAYEASKCWHGQYQEGLYHDEGSVYAAEQARRRKALSPKRVEIVSADADFIGVRDAIPGDENGGVSSIGTLYVPVGRVAAGTFVAAQRHDAKLFSELVYHAHDGYCLVDIPKAKGGAL